jgi:hypothetical protein
VGRVSEKVFEALAEPKNGAAIADEVIAEAKPTRRIPAPPGNSLKCYEFEAQLWRLYSPAGSLPEDIELDQFWNNIDPSRFKIYDHVSVVEETGAWCADAVVVDLTPGLNPAVKVASVIRRQERKDAVTNGVHADFDVEYSATTNTWGARRKSNGVMLVEMMPSLEDLRRAVLDHASVKQGSRVSAF